MSTAPSNESSVLEFLDLPQIKRDVSNCGPYGAAAIAAEYCGFTEAPELSPSSGIWQHDWFPSHWELNHPDMLLRIATSHEQPYWVARQEDEKAVRSQGYTNVKAIGLPIVYVRPPTVIRRPGSLLVMPVHTLDYKTHEWRFDEYAEQIYAIRKDFSTVVVCLHPSCWLHGYWIHAFRRRGITLVEGADLEDRNALLRICTLLGGFEYLTTNGFGSHIAYGAYLGAKVSVFGVYAEYKAEDYNTAKVYLENPQILRSTVEYVSEASMRKHLPHFFCHPREAKERVDWGRREVGEDNRVSPSRLRSLFEWDWRSRLMRRLRDRVPSKLKRVLRLVAKPGNQKASKAVQKQGEAANEKAAEIDRQQEAAKEKAVEIERLLSFPRNRPTTTMLLGFPFEVTDATCFVFLSQQIWERELYRFQTDTKTPFIIDGGANIGLSVAYFKRLFPRSRVLAFEPDPDIYKVLARNCKQLGLDEGDVYCEALWSCAGELEFKQEDQVAGRVIPNGDGHSVKVSARRLRDLLDRDVDMLKLDIEGAETEVLRDCAGQLGGVKNLFVEYHSYQDQPQTLDEIIGILKAAGFRVYLESDQTVNQPFQWRPVLLGMDMRLNIFAYRMPQRSG
jgi:FkbM family methyltransferase